MERFTHEDFFFFFFWTHWIFWGPHSGTFVPSGIINHHSRALHGDSKTKKRCQKRASFCPQSLFFLFTLTKRRVRRLRCGFQMLSACLMQNQVFGLRLKKLRLTKIYFFVSAQIFKHMLTRDLLQQPRFLTLFLPPTVLDPKFKRENLVLSPLWCLSCRGDASTLTRIPWWGRWRRWAPWNRSTMRSLCEKAERSVPGPYPWQPIVDQRNCVSAVASQEQRRQKGENTSSQQASVDGILTIRTPAMVPASERESWRWIASLGSDANEPRSLCQLF